MPLVGEDAALAAGVPQLEVGVGAPRGQEVAVGVEVDGGHGALESKTSE